MVLGMLLQIVENKNPVIICGGEMLFGVKL